MLRRRQPVATRVAAVWLVLGAIGGCQGGAAAIGDPVAAVKTKPENGGVKVATDEWALVPVPPADGPKLAPVAMVVPVYAKPDRQSEPVGYLRAGARVARSDKPVSQRDCAGGWYAIRPVGFVCVQENATNKLDHPVARAIAGGAGPHATHAVPVCVLPRHRSELPARAHQRSSSSSTRCGSNAI